MHTLIRNPVNGAEWLCPDKALDRFLSIGWELLPAESDEGPATEEPHDAAESIAQEQE